MANYLILNQNQVFNGLGTLSFVVPTTGNYNVRCQTTVPQAWPTGDGAGSGTGLGSGAGGGDIVGFAAGGSGTSNGGMGQGFGAVPNNYQQPPAYGSNETMGDAVSSGVSILVKDNGSTIYTAPTLGVAESALQFNFGFQATAGHTITVVIASSTASDEGLNGVISNVSIGEGFF